MIRLSFACLLALLLLPHPVAAEGDTHAVNFRQRIGPLTVDSGLEIRGGPDGLGVTSHIGLERDGRIRGIESHLNVLRDKDGLHIDSGLRHVRDESVSGVDSGLGVRSTDGGGLDVDSRFGLTRDGQRQGIRNDISVPGPTQLNQLANELAGREFGTAASPAQRERIAQLKSVIAEVLTREPAADAWWSGYNLCTDLSGKWLPELEAHGLKLTLQATDTNSARATVVVDGREEQVHKFHVFLADLSLGTGENEIIFDPTWQQFLAEAGRDPGLPRIFIGTRAEARSLYSMRKAYLRVEAGEGGDPRTGRYEPASLTELIYSFGRNTGARISYDIP